jgi:uncharacterized SAM-binding protein YcdF (DUF218 family)
MLDFFRFFFNQILLPPFSLIIISFILLVLIRPATGWKRRLTHGALIVILGASLPISGKVIIWLTNTGYETVDIDAIQLPKHQQVGIFLPTAGNVIYGNLIMPSTDSIKRAVQALKIHQKHNIPLLISGGDPRHTGESEAITLFKRLKRDNALGDLSTLAPIWLEERSLNSFENALYSAKILNNHNITIVILVTDSLHMTRMRYVLENNGFTVLSVYSQAMQPIEISDFIPSHKGIYFTRKSIKSLIGLAFYWISGKF